MKAVILLALLFVTVMCKPIDYEDVDDKSNETDTNTGTTEKAIDSVESINSQEDTTDKVGAADTEYEDVVSTTEGVYDAEPENYDKRK